MFSLPVEDITALAIAALVTSTISGAIGMGGGILLLIVMAGFLPPAVLIPLHGIVQLTSNLSRSIMNFSHLDFKIISLFLSGAVLGAFAGSFVLVKIPEDYFMIILACGILILTWLPKKKFQLEFPAKFFFVGMAAEFLSLFIGAIGPFIAPFYLHGDLKKEQIVATKAGCQTGTHILKIIVYFLSGFSLGKYIPIIAILMLMVIVGNYLGKLLLKRISEQKFTLTFRVLITALAIKMIWDGFIFFR